MYLRASEMSKQAWSEAVKTNNLEEHMLLDPLYYSFGDKEQKCWGVQVNVGGVQNMLGGCTNEVGGVRTPRTPPENPPVLVMSYLMKPDLMYDRKLPPVKIVFTIITVCIIH